MQHGGSNTSTFLATAQRRTQGSQQAELATAEGEIKLRDRPPEEEARGVRSSHSLTP